MDKVMKRYAFKDWDSVLASIGHGGLKEGQVINKMMEERVKKIKREVTDATILDGIGDMNGKAPETKKSKNGIMVKGIHDVGSPVLPVLQPGSGDEIVGFVTRGRGVSIHRTDCINIINLPGRASRLIDAEWQQPEGGDSKERYSTEIQIFANNRIGMFVDISKVFTERQIDITSMNVRTSKQGQSDHRDDLDIRGIEELNRLTDKLRQIEGFWIIENGGLRAARKRVPGTGAVFSCSSADTKDLQGQTFDRRVRSTQQSSIRGKIQGGRITCLDRRSHGVVKDQTVCGRHDQHQLLYCIQSTTGRGESS